MSFNPLWENIYANREWGKYPNENVVRFIAGNFYKFQRDDISILEIGCGSGANLWYIAKEGFNTFGIDGSETAISICRNYLNSELKIWKGEVLVGDIVNLPFHDKMFDAIIDCEAIYCNSFLDSKKIISEVYRVLKINGLFLSITFAKGCIGDETGEQVEKNFYIPTRGPLEGKGTARFTEEIEIPSLYAPFNIKSVEMVSRTINNMKDYIKEFVVTCKK